MSQKWGFFDGIRVCRVSGGQLLILINFFGPFNLALDGFMAAPSLISHHSESALWNSGKVMEAGVLPTRNGEQKGVHAREPHRATLSFALAPPSLG